MISADSRSMLMNGKRVYPISGEVRAIHSDVLLFNPIHAFSAAHTCALVVPCRVSNQETSALWGDRHSLLGVSRE